MCINIYLYNYDKIQIYKNLCRICLCENTKEYIKKKESIKRCTMCKNCI